MFLQICGRFVRAATNQWEIGIQLMNGILPGNLKVFKQCIVVVSDGWRAASDGALCDYDALNAAYVNWKN